jgi:hypothetical protein
MLRLYKVRIHFGRGMVEYTSDVISVKVEPYHTNSDEKLQGRVTVLIVVLTHLFMGGRYRRLLLPCSTAEPFLTLMLPH